MRELALRRGHEGRRMRTRLIRRYGFQRAVTCGAACETAYSNMAQCKQRHFVAILVAQASTSYAQEVCQAGRVQRRNKRIDV